LAHAVTMKQSSQLPSSLGAGPIPVQNTDPGTQFVGLVIFLGSATVMFSALFFSFALYRLHAAAAWPPPALVDVPLWMPTVSTGLILASSILLEWSRRHAVAGRLAVSRKGVLGTFGLALLFVAMQCWLWSVMWAQGVTLSSGQFASFFYLLTVFHALHVVVGLGLLLYFARCLQTDPVWSVAVPARLITLFWHFVGVVWGLLFVLLFFS
jgi:cytochrome c oxidase subunit 3